MTNVHVLEGGIDGWSASDGEVVESPSPKVQARGPVLSVRKVLVDRERAYGGAFNGELLEVGGAGG